MRFLIGAIGLAFLQTSTAITLARAVSEPRVVQFETTREHHVSADELEKRDSGLSAPLYPDTNGKIRIVVNVTLGTPPQSFGLALDTGSSDFVVRTSGSPLCAAGNCTAYGSFDPAKSTTYNDTKTVFKTSYGEGTTASGTLATDILSLGGATLPNFTFAACDQSNVTDNVFGVGFLREEAVAVMTGAQTYRNGPFAMKDAGLIKTAAYSVWLNDLNSGSGSVLFGGVDTAKYSGTLQTVPVVQQYTSKGELVFGAAQISLDAVGTAKGKSTTLTTASGFPINVLLDTGSLECILPQPIADNLCSAFGCTVQGRNYLLPCSMAAPNSGNISFAFSGINITVPLSQFVRPYGWPNGFCSFDIAVTNDPTSYILGDSFLRAVYAVYNLEAGEIALAPTVYNATTSNIVEIVSGAPGGIPNSQNASNVRSGIPSATGTIGPAVTASGTEGAAAVALSVVGVAAVAFFWGM